MKLSKQAKIRLLFALGQYYCLEDGFVASRQHGYPRVLSTRVNNSGYLLVTLFDGKHPITAGVHQVVYLYFKGVYAPKLQVNHIDGKKLNNSIINLAAVTASENQLHASKNGLFRDQRGAKSHSAKLTTIQVLAIRRRSKQGETGVSLAKEFGVTQSNISCILKNKSWGHV